MSEQDISNRLVSKVFSIEMIVLVFTVGVSWATLAKSQDVQAINIDSNTKEIAEVKKALNRIEKDTAIIVNDQKHVRALMERVLNIVEKR